MDTITHHHTTKPTIHFASHRKVVFISANKYNSNFSMAEWQDMFGNDDDSDFSGDEEEVGIGSHGEEEVDTINKTPPPFVVKQIPGIGGMRGIFAARDLPAGTLILAECPVYTWKGHFSNVDVLRRTVTDICSSDKAYATTQALHPFVLEDADEDEIATMRELWGDALPLTVSDLSSRSGPEIDSNEVLRVSITLQHNAYGSGFYQIFSLVNHTCAPNCTKLYPSAEKGWRKASEIWTNRDVKEGDELTICYNHIREMTDLSIAQFLHDHHRFQCHCPIHSVASYSQLDTKEENEASAGEETTLVDDWSSVLQERAEYYEEQLEQSIKTKDLDVLFDIITVCEDILTGIADYMKNYPEQFPSMKNILNGFVTVKGNQLLKPDHYFNSNEPIMVKERDAIYMMVRLHKITVSAASVSIEELGKKESTLLSKQKSDKAKKVFQRLLWAAEQYLTHAVAVAPLQLYYLGEAHPDIAQTFLDIAEGISCSFSLYAGASKYEKTVQTTTQKPNETEEENKDILMEANILPRLHAFNSETFSWARSHKSAQQMMENIRKEGERIANLYRPRYDLVQERLVTASLQMPDAYS
mgnify:FL=1